MLNALKYPIGQSQMPHLKFQEANALRKYLTTFGDLMPGDRNST